MVIVRRYGGGLWAVDLDKGHRHEARNLQFVPICRTPAVLV